MRAVVAVTAVAWLMAAAPLSAARLVVQVNAIDVTRLPRVRAYVTVLDEKGQTVKGLRRESFALADAPLQIPPQPLNSFLVHSVLQSGQSLAVALVLDRSGSMKGAPLAAAQRGALEFLTRTSAGDQVAVLSFADTVREDCAPTADRNAVRAAIQGLAAGGDTALYDAAMQAVRTVADVPKATRKAAVLLTDGRKTTGQVDGPEPVASLAQDEGVRLYTIGLGREPDHATLAKLAGETGGAHFKAAKPADLLAVYQRVADRLQNEYVLTFDRKRSAAFRELVVTVTRGHESGSGSRKYRPAVSAKPQEAPPAPTPVPAAAPTQSDWRPLAAVAMLALVVGLLIAIIVTLKRR